MNILYIAYSCSPYHGSEDKIGWNVPVESAKTNRVFVLTREEQRKFIEEYLSSNPIANIEFYYVDIPEIWKKIFNGPFYSGRLNFYNKRGLKIAREICDRERIDVIHQITPVEFRSIGDYGTLPNIKFVCGPVGGGEYMPAELKEYAGGHMAVEWIRCLVNGWYKHRLTRPSDRGKQPYLLFANAETAGYLGYSQCRDRIRTEIGISRENLRDVSQKAPHKTCRFLVVGRLVYRKGHMLLFDALMRIPREHIWECSIVGDGPELVNLKRKCLNSGLSDRVHFAGNVQYSKMKDVYANADVLVMPSLRETTGSVVLEAMANSLPVLTIGKYGAATILNEDSGWMYDGQTRDDYINNLASALVDCIIQPDEVLRRGRNARKLAEAYTWDVCEKYYQTIYDELMNQV